MSNTTPNLNLFKYDPTSDGENTFNIDTCMNENWDKIDTAVSNIGIENKTYAELKVLKDNNQLKQGKKYLLTDYQTKYQQPTTLVIKEMQVEQLILTASSSNAFQPIVYSSTYPQDIIYYDFNNNKCEDNITDRKGFIQYRIDTLDGNEAPQDWRTMLWARYKPDANQYYKNNSLVEYGTWTGGSVLEGSIYKKENELYLAIRTTTPSSWGDENSIVRILKSLDDAFLITDKLTIFKTAGNEIKLKIGDVKERFTFGEGAKNNKIGYSPKLHNNVLGDGCLRNVLQIGCYNNTFEELCLQNTLGVENNNNIFLRTSSNNILSNHNNSNFFGEDCTANSLDTNCLWNVFTCSSSNNSLGSGNLNNYFGFRCSSNTFASSCMYNVLESFSYDNFFGNKCVSNIMGFSSYRNTFGNNCSSNEFKLSGDYNKLGDYCYNNKVDNACEGNTFGEYCYGNELKYNCDNISIGNYCRQNIFKDNCSNITLLQNCSANVFGERFKNILIKYLNNKNLTNVPDFSYDCSFTIEKGRNSNYYVWWLGVDSKPVYTAIP